LKVNPARFGIAAAVTVNAGIAESYVAVMLVWVPAVPPFADRVMVDVCAVQVVLDPLPPLVYPVLQVSIVHRSATVFADQVADSHAFIPAATVFVQVVQLPEALIPAVPVLPAPQAVQVVLADVDVE
jgi:hypothetical protein